MAFPALYPTPGHPMRAKALGAPNNGNETIPIPWVPLLGYDPALVTKANLSIGMRPGNVAGVSAVKFVSLAPDKSSITVEFTTSTPGVGTCFLTVDLQHSQTR